MAFKSRPKYENLETGRTTEHAFVFDNGPMVIKDDDRRGLVLAANRHKYMLEFCTQVRKKTDKISTKRPKNSLLANSLTQELIRAGGLFCMPNSIVPSVYSYDDVIKHAYPKWRHTSDIVQRHYHQKAMRQLAESSRIRAYTLNINISPKLGKAIIKHGGCGYLFDRLSVKLKRALGWSPRMWLILEASRTNTNSNPTRKGKGAVSQSEGVLHAHGAIAIGNEELTVLKRLVRDLNESSDPVFKNNEFSVKQISDDTYWVEYCNKHRFLNKMLLNGMHKYSCSKELASLGRELYQLDRIQFKNVHSKAE
jgi:hypothetical protein